MSKKQKTSKSTPTGSPRRRRKVRKQNLTWLWIGLGVIVISVAAYLLWPKHMLQVQITTAQAYEKFQQGAFFLDVRSESEWNQAHIANSTLIPLDELQSRLSELPQDQDIVVVCLSGKRSKEGMTILQQAGFTGAVCMTGGLTAWKAAGYPLEGSTP
jgi:rhodanese-related sulfurtransferase